MQSGRQLLNGSNPTSVAPCGRGHRRWLLIEPVPFRGAAIPLTLTNSGRSLAAALQPL